MSLDATNSTTTVIVGGGFAGLFTALHLRHCHYEHPIILIDAQSRFVFKPLLYEYLTGEMAEEQVTPTYAELLQGSNVDFVQDTVSQIDLHQRQVTLSSGVHYDYQNLVLAVGSIQGYFGTEGAEQNAFPFRTQADALRLRQHLHDCLQQASRMSGRTERQKLLTFAVIGAGPSGVEMSATLADLLPGWYSQLGGDLKEIRIVLVNHSQEILEGDVNTGLRDAALQALRDRAIPVELMLGVKVESVAPDQIHYQPKGQDHKILTSATAIWTTGTATNPLIKSISLPADALDKHGQLLVTPTLQIPAFPEVFAAGDCAAVQPKPLPSVAQIAYQQGAGIAHNLLALSRGESPQPIEAKMRGTLMKLGIHNGIANLFDKVQINGQAGDLIRNATYLEMLPTPVHNFKAITEWLDEEIFRRHSDPAEASVPAPTPPNRLGVWAGGIAIAAALSLGLFTIWQSQQSQPSSPQQTNQQ